MATSSNLDHILLKSPVNVVENGLHCCVIVLIQNTEWLLVMTNYLDVSRKQDQLENIINVATFGEVIESPCLQGASSCTLLVFDCQIQGDLGRELTKETSSMSSILHFDTNQLQNTVVSI